MSLLVYANPQGATTNTPFPTDASRKIYFQEVNNMFDQVRLFINGNIDPVNFNLPFVQSLTWAISGSNQALNIASTSTNSVIDIAQTTSVMTAGKGLVQLSTDALNPATTSIVKLIQNNISDNATIWHAETDSTAAAARWMRITSVGAGTEYWSFHRDAASSEVRSNIKTGDSHVFQVNGVEAAKIAATSMTLPTAGNLVIGNTTVASDVLTMATAGVLTIGTSTLSETALTLGDTGSIKFGVTTIQQGANDTEVMVNALRINATDGPVISRHSLKIAQIDDAIALHSANPIFLTRNSTFSALGIQKDGGSIRAAVVGTSENEAFKIYRGRIRTSNGEIMLGSDFTTVKLGTGETRITLANVLTGAPGSQANTAPVVTATSYHSGTVLTLNRGIITNIVNPAVSGTEYAFTIRTVRTNDGNTPVEDAELYFDFIAIAVRGD